MTRFDAATPAERRSLVADTIVAHRERGSIFCTVEADAPPGGPIEVDEEATAADVGEDANAVEGAAAEASDAPAWIQFSAAESQLNLDCTDEEYDRITDVLGTASAFTIDDQASPEDADGRNLRVTSYADPERIADVVDRIFVEGFDYEADFRLWATEI
ncbi:hypothetical protein GCM10028857_12880 [Salinarchaeum chitinilyticum]